MWRHFALALLCFTAAVTASERSPAKVRIYHERSTQAELIASVEALGKTHHLKLKRTLVPSVRMQELVVGVNGTVTIQEVGENLTRSFYEDKGTGALLFMNDENTLEGMLSDSVALHYDNNEHSASEINEKTAAPFCGVSEHSSFKKVLPKEVRNFHGENRGISFIAEILVVADSKLTNGLGQYLEDYMRLYWKMVDRRFRTVAGASISLRLTDILVCTTTACDDVVMDASDYYISDMPTSLDKFAAYLATYKSQLNPFDLAHLMTARDLYYHDPAYLSYTGLAFIGTPCIVSANYAYNTGISEDFGFYGGILTTAHEIGHNLGAGHDPEDSSSCSWELGYIMSYYKVSYRTFLFSPCSSQAMIDTYNDPSSSCLWTNDNTYWEPYPNHLAGSSFTFDEQCTWHTGVSSAIARQGWSEDSLCYLLRCQYTSGSYIYYPGTYYPALEGTPCSSGGYCLDGSCQP